MRVCVHNIMPIVFLPMHKHTHFTFICVHFHIVVLNASLNVVRMAPNSLYYFEHNVMHDFIDLGAGFRVSASKQTPLIGIFLMEVFDFHFICIEGASNFWFAPVM